MLVDTHIHWPLSHSLEPGQFVDILDKYGIDYAVVSGIEVLMWNEKAPAWNDKLAQLCRKAPDRLIPMPTVHFNKPDETVDEAKRCIDKLGGRGFKIHPWLQGNSVSCKEMYKLCEIAAEHNVPLMFHDGTPVYSLPSQIGLLANMFPETIFVLGHSGILYFWAEAIEVARQNSNVYLTLCGGHPWALQTICDQADENRILWGSDFIRPGNEDMIEYRRDLLECIKISKTIRDKMTAENAIRLYRIDVTKRKI